MKFTWRCCRCGLGNHAVQPGSQLDRCRFAPPVQMSAAVSFIAATIMSACPWGAQGTGIAGLRVSCPSPGGAADRSVFPARISQQAWERVNTLPAGRVNDVRGWTGPLRGEPDLLAGGLDLSTLEAAGCAAGPAGQRFPDCSDPPAMPTLGICPGDGIVRRRNQPDLQFPY